MTLGMEVGLSPGNIVLDGDPAPPKRGTATPQFLAHVYCGQTAGWTKMPYGTKVGLNPGNIVLHGDPVHAPERGIAAPTFRQMSIVVKRQDGSKYHLVWR